MFALNPIRFCHTDTILCIYFIITDNFLIDMTTTSNLPSKESNVFG